MLLRHTIIGQTNQGRIQSWNLGGPLLSFQVKSFLALLFAIENIAVWGGGGLKLAYDMAKIILNRTRTKIRPEIAQEQFGFVARKGTTNAIYIYIYIKNNYRKIIEV